VETNRVKSSVGSNKVFLTANWRRLTSINFAIDPKVLHNHLPKGTELEAYNGEHYVSLVGFRYCDTRLRNVRIPGHTRFEEINLRFYVRRKLKNGQWRSEVAFTKLFFPKPALTFVAKRIYKENYETRKMRHKWVEDDAQLSVSYALRKDSWQSFEVLASRKTERINPENSAHFFSKHYWGTSRIGNGASTIYKIDHPEWNMHPVYSWNIDVDFATVFGPEFQELSTSKPESVQLFDGSEVVVRKRDILR
jgi:uncharacterized protein YqjF (DUF2071 family)